MFFIHLFNTIMNVKVIFLLAALLTAPLLASPVNASPTSSYQINKGTSVRERLAQIRAMMNRGNYTAAKAALKKMMSGNLNSQLARDMYAECETAIKQQQEAIKLEFDEACESESKWELESFIRKYPNSQYTKEAREQLADLVLWQQATTLNTIEAYQRYLSKTSVFAYTQAANTKIKELKEEETRKQMEQDWRLIKDAGDESALNEFMKKYPQTNYLDQIKKRLNILRGIRCYKQGDTSSAYSYLSAANEQETLTGEAATYLKELQAKREYEEIAESNDIDRVKYYLNALSTSSPYYNKACNLYAILLAKQLSSSSVDYDYQLALSYVKDEATRTVVTSYINVAKVQRSTYVHRRKVLDRKQWWRTNLQVGIEGDFETNLSDNIGSDMFYSGGLMIRFGSYQQVVSMTAGAKFRVFMVNPNLGGTNRHGEDERWNVLGYAVGVPVNVRFNVARLSTRSRFFIGGGIEFGVTTIEKEKNKGVMNKSYMAYYPQIGVLSPNFEMTLYWKTYAPAPFSKNITSRGNIYDCKSMIGASMSIFF